jgi:hypothetical protein
VYWSLRRLLELAVLRSRSEREKEIEILLLRHQLRVLERQVGPAAAHRQGRSCCRHRQRRADTKRTHQKRHARRLATHEGPSELADLQAKACRW